MAEEKVRMSWELKNADLICSIGTVIVGTFNLLLIWPTFLDFEEVARELGAYGVKQKLADSTARSKEAKLTLTELKDQLASMWKQLSVDKKFTTGTRTGDGLLKHNQMLGMFDQLVQNGLTEAVAFKMVLNGKDRAGWLAEKTAWEAKKQSIKEAASGVEIPKTPEAPPEEPKVEKPKTVLRKKRGDK
jgi:hypothetical protein